MMMFTALARCSKENPALLIGIHLLLGAASALHPHPAFFIIAAALWALLLFQKKWKSLLYFGCFTAAFFYTSFLYPPLALPAKKCSGTAKFHISSLSISPSPFKPLYRYKGMITHFESEDKEQFKNIPCALYMPLSKERYLADHDYLIEGVLVEKENRNYLFKPKKKTAWKKLEKNGSFAEWRYIAKQKVKSFLKRQIPDKRSASFLTALFTGELDERELSLEFSHLGLSHILAISGFHFAILAAFFGFFLRLFLSYRMSALVLLLLLTLYFFFIGPSPSVQRGWIALMVFLVGILCNRRCSGLNALGIGICIAVAIDPLLVTNLGFQLSYLATAAIFLFYPEVSRLAAYLLPKRTLSTVSEMSFLDKHVYLFSSLIRESLALTIAVHLFVLPLLLFSFHKFPYLSLLYNLFFPFWTSAVFLLFLGTLLLSFIPPLAALLHQINSTLTHELLELTASPPPFLDVSLYCKTLPLWAVIALTTGLLILAVHLHYKERAFVFK